VRVVARLRPLSQKEIKEKCKESIHGGNSSKSLVTTLHNTTKVFEYDDVLLPNATQMEVYERTAGSAVRRDVMRGFNTTILAYGQTGSGKTYTMGTEGGADEATSTKSCSSGQKLLIPPSDSDGIIPRAVYDLFLAREERGRESVKVELSYLEIYNEECRDLLDDCNSNTSTSADGGASAQQQQQQQPKDLVIREGSDGGVVVIGLQSVVVDSPVEVREIMGKAALRRATASTNMNAVSSRSHAICTLTVTILPKSSIANDNNDEEDGDASSGEMTAKLTLVDLAGSERIKRTGAEGKRMKEGININKGLFVLGQVVSTLSEMGQQNSDGTSSSSAHVPYRDSKLTRLLQDSLGGNSRTIMVACVSPADSNSEESLNTLRYAQRARNIKNSAVRNVVASSISPAEAASLRRENQMLKLQLLQAQASLKEYSMSTATVHRAVNEHASSTSGSLNAIGGFDAAGVNVEKLDVVLRLRATCLAQQTKIGDLESRLNQASDDVLKATINEDRWRLKFEHLVASSPEAQNNESASNGEGSTLHKELDILSIQRKEIAELKKQLIETETDADVARATAAAVVQCGGDLKAAEEFSYETIGNVDSDEENTPKRMRKTEKLSSEIIAMSSGIESKETMALQMVKEGECFDRTLKEHFVSAIAHLQDEVDTLSSERAQLMAKVERIENSPNSGGPDESQRKIMRERVVSLEKKIKELQQKSSEHTKALRMRDIAQKKCIALQAEVADDKRRRTSLQKKLKEEAVGRKQERLAARKEATKLLRDSQKLKLEIRKIKDTAAKQAIVLRRKAAEAAAKQKAENERKKRQQHASASRAREMTNVRRKDEIVKWMEREIELGAVIRTTKTQIDAQQDLLIIAKSKMDDLLDERDAGGNVHSEIRVISEEISARSSVINQLQRSIVDITKVPELTSCFIDMEMWQGLSRQEIRFLAASIFEQFLSCKENADKLQTKQNEAITSAVSKAVSDEKCRSEEALMNLKMDHSEAIMSLMDATKGTVEHKINSDLLKSIEDGIDPNVREVIDDMLGSYISGCDKIGNAVKEELREVKEKQEGMKSLMDQIAQGVVLKPTKMKKKARKRVVDDTSYDEVKEIFTEDLSDDGADSDDSDWSPTELREARRRRSKKDKKELNKEKQATVRGNHNEEGIGVSASSKRAPDFEDFAANRQRPATQVEPINTSITSNEGASECFVRLNESIASNENVRDSASFAGETPMELDLDTMKVADLKALLRERGLPVSGRKAELLKRLKDDFGLSNGHGGPKESNKSKSTNVTNSTKKRIPLASKSTNVANRDGSSPLAFMSPNGKRRNRKVFASSGKKRRRNLNLALTKTLTEVENALK